MRCKTKIDCGEGNICSIYFTYEDYGGSKYGSYDEMKENGRKPFYIIGYLHSSYWNSYEPIDELHLSKRPTIGQVKKFITHCKKVIMED